MARRLPAGGTVLRMIIWRGSDPPGHEACRLTATTFEGMAVLAQPPTALTYRVICDEAWRTRSATVTGHIESRAIDLSIEVRDARWYLDGVLQPQLDACVDVDLNFTPATNTIPIRRLGTDATITVAWLRFPTITLEPLAQTYRRLGDRSWQYTSDGFTARMDVDEEGLVTTYEGLWVRA